MGGSRPSAPVTVMPSPTAPSFYQSQAPKESFEDVAGYLKRIQEETGKIQGQRYQEVGTPAELGARMAGRRLQETSAYQASLPKGDKYLQQTTGVADPYAQLRDAVSTQKYQASAEYEGALARMGEKPTPTINETPEWATRPDSTWNVKQAEGSQKSLGDFTSAEIAQALKQGTYRAATAEKPTSIGQFSKADLEKQSNLIG